MVCFGYVDSVDRLLHTELVCCGCVDGVDSFLHRVLLCGGPLRGLFAMPAPSDVDALVVVAGGRKGD